MTADDDAVTFELRDEGKPFDPTAADTGDVVEATKQQKMGGLGIHLIRHYMDEICYERQNNQNVLTMKKFLRGKK